MSIIAITFLKIFILPVFSNNDFYLSRKLFNELYIFLNYLTIFFNHIQLMLFVQSLSTNILSEILSQKKNNFKKIYNYNCVLSTL